MTRNFIQQLRRRFGSSATFLGQFGYSINGGEYAWERNRVVDQGLNYILNAGLRGEGVLSSFYIAPFAANVTPAANLTAATFASAMTEFTNYDESARPQWNTDASSTALELVNNTAPALITIGAGGQTTIWGAGLISVSPKSSTSGLLVAAQKRGTALTVEDDFELRIKYRITAASS